ncbi:hypothetical protein COCVIDRAFT_31759 [Bipolaris victoriae FI3]|uniref:FAD-binding domain-containing protein n=1 Tax=Bipolaris victoriae (strain FI3) TaxID=930091 RepID=W7EA45_BIPV3|nr:hypothetical protein COCVIDRAFT_31759 [Bipolaris victoriae FI3]
MTVPQPKTAASTMQRKPPTGISVLVVGSGLGGLTFIIEAYRQGHDVQIIEKRPKLEDFGEAMIIQAPIHKDFKAWPGFLEKVLRHTVQPSEIHVFQHNGKSLGNFPLGTPELPSLAVNRLGMHIELAQYAKDLGIETQYSTHAAEYMETDDAGVVVLSDGRKLTADVVVAADGVGSRSWKLILDKFEKPDIGHAKEDWWWTTSADDALPFVETWSPFVKEIIKFTPGNSCIDWQLMWRNPQPKWVSPKGRVVQIGDSAHTFLPSSASGASMAMEDGFSLAACLQMAGKQEIPLANRVHNKLRFERVACAQKMGFKNRQKFHTSDSASTEENLESIGNFTGQWLLRHDPVGYAYDNFQACADHLLWGTEFKNTNLVPGHTFKQWTVTEFLEAQEQGRVIEEYGDWS